MTRQGLLGKPMYGEVPYNYGTVTALDGRAHLKLAGIPFLLARDPFTGRHQYGRDQAPTFVNKFGSGDPTYRDSSFFPHWVQLNWRNGAKQDEFDDEGKFKTSKNLTVTEEQELTISRLLSSLSLSAGTGVDVICFAIDYSDSNKVFAGCSNGHVWRHNGSSWSDMGDVSAVGGGTAGRRVNALIFSKIGLDGARATGAGQIYAAVGTPAGTGGKNTAQLYRYDGTWASAATFSGYDAATSLCEFGGEMYIALGGTAVIQKCSTANLATGWTTSKDIDYPGYIWDMVVYNARLYAGGGHPENSPTTYNNGTLYVFDGFAWDEVNPFSHTVIRSLQVYDNLLFIGTMHGQLYVYNRATIDLLYEMPEKTVIFDMIVFDDKLYIAVGYKTSTSGDEAVYVFDRAGTSKIYSNDSLIPMALVAVGNDLWIGGQTNGNAYKVDTSKYAATGELQSSYFDANLPSIDKVWFDVAIEMDSLPTGGKVEMYYKTDESDAAWTKIDETTEVGKKLALFAFPAATYSKKLSYKIIVTTSVNTTTPKIKKIIIRYILQPDFRYLWKFKVVCPDNLVWLDGSEPTALLNASTENNASTIELSDATGFPDPDGEQVYARIRNKTTGVDNDFYYTGLEGNTLTGCSGVSAHDITTDSFEVAIDGRHLHRKILELKKRKAILTFIDIDNTNYSVLMHDFTEDNWVLNMNEGLENEVGISLLQA